MLGQMILSNDEPSSEGVNQDFRRDGSPAGQLLPYLTGEYVGRCSTKLYLRVFDFKARFWQTFYRRKRPSKRQFATAIGSVQLPENLTKQNKKLPRWLE